MPAARAPSTSSAGVSPTWRASSAAQPASRSAGSKIAGSGFRGASLGGGDDAVERSAEAAAGEHLGQREVPVRDADQAQPELAQLGQRGRGVGGRRGSGSRPSSPRPETSLTELAREDRGAAPRAGPRASSASRPSSAVLAVVAHLGAQGRARGARRARCPAPGQVDPRRLELDQRPERIEQQRVTGPSTGAWSRLVIASDSSRRNPPADAAVNEEPTRRGESLNLCSSPTASGI